MMMNALRKPLQKHETTRNRVVIRDTIIGLTDMPGAAGRECWCWRVRVRIPETGRLYLNGDRHVAYFGLAAPVQVCLRFPTTFIQRTADGQATSAILQMLYRNEPIPGWDTASRMPGGGKQQAQLRLKSPDRACSAPVVVTAYSPGTLWTDVELTVLSANFTWW